MIERQQITRTHQVERTERKTQFYLYLWREYAIINMLTVSIKWVRC